MKTIYVKTEIHGLGYWKAVRWIKFFKLYRITRCTKEEHDDWVKTVINS